MHIGGASKFSGSVLLLNKCGGLFHSGYIYLKTLCVSWPIIGFLFIGFITQRTQPHITTCDALIQ